MSTGYTTVSAAHLQDATGTPITNATISFTPVDNNGKPLSFRTGGTQGQTVVTPITAVVTGGAFSVTLADTSLTSPINVGYKVTVLDNASSDCLLGAGYGCFQPSGDSYDFDSYVPNLAGQVTVQTGPQGLSAYQVWLAAGNTGSESDYLATLVGPTTTAQLFNAVAPILTKSPNRFGAAGTNMIDPNDWVVGSVYVANGTPTAGFGGGFACCSFLTNGATEFVTNITGAAGIGSHSLYPVVFFDVLGNLLSVIESDPVSGTAYAIPASAYKIGISIRTGYIAPTVIMINAGSTLLPFTSFAYAPLSQLTIIEGIQTLVESYQPSLRNMFDQSSPLIQANTGMHSGTPPSSATLSGVFLSAPMQVHPGGTYTVAVPQDNNTDAFFGIYGCDPNGENLVGILLMSQQLSVFTTFTIPAGITQLFLCDTNDHLGTQMILPGTQTALTVPSYLPFLGPVAAAAPPLSQLSVVEGVQALVETYQPGLRNMFDKGAIALRLNTGMQLNGNIESFSDLFVSAPMQVQPGKTYTIAEICSDNTGAFTCVAGYDQNGANVAIILLMSQNQTPFTTFVIPSGITQIVICNRMEILGTQMVLPGVQTALTVPSYLPFLGPVPSYAEQIPASGVRIAAIGDSLIQTKGQNWLPTLFERLNAATNALVFEDAQSGREVGQFPNNYSENWATGVRVADGSVNGTNTGTAGNTLLQDLTATNPGVVLFFGGTNNTTTTLGTITDTPSLTGTYYARMLACIGMLVPVVNQLPNCRLAIMGIYEVNAGGCTPAQCAGIAQANHDVADQFRVPYIDLIHNCGISQISDPAAGPYIFTEDGTHVNVTYGGPRIGKIVAQRLQEIL